MGLLEHLGAKLAAPDGQSIYFLTLFRQWNKSAALPAVIAVVGHSCLSQQRHCQNLGSKAV